jgi:type VI protein secretion system component VasK
VTLDPEKFGNLQAAMASLEVLVGPESPYSELFQKVWAGQSIRFSEAEQPRNLIVSDFQWLESAIKALGGLKEALSFFTGRTRPGQRILVDRQVNDNLPPLVEAFQKAYDDITNAVNGIPDVRHRGIAREIIVNAVDSTRQALMRECHEEVNSLWTEEVHAVFARTAAGKYPFDEAAEEQVPVADFSRFFNPKSGILLTTREVLKDLEALNISSEPLVDFSLNFEAAMKRADAITKALYAPEEEILTVPFEITLKQREGVQRIEISLENEKFEFYDRPDHRGKLTWVEGKSEGAKLSIRVGENQWRSQDFSKEPWGLFRLFRAGMDPTGTGPTEKSFSLNWTFTADVRGKEQVFAVDADVSLERENPFRPHFFEEFRCPEKVSP